MLIFSHIINKCVFTKYELNFTVPLGDMSCTIALIRPPLRHFHLIRSRPLRLCPLLTTMVTPLPSPVGPPLDLLLQLVLAPSPPPTTPPPNSIVVMMSHHSATVESTAHHSTLSMADDVLITVLCPMTVLSRSTVKID
jgi:hypothetical protein